MGKKIRLHMNERVLQEVYAAMQADIPGSVVAAFFLGVQVCETVNGIGVGKSPSDKLVELLIGIANGEETLVPSGTELRQKAPHVSDLESIRFENQRVSQVLARLIAERCGKKRT